MKAPIVIVALAAGAFALVACKPKVETIREEVSADADQAAEDVSEIIDVATEEVEPVPGEQAPSQIAPSEPAPE